MRWPPHFRDRAGDGSLELKRIERSPLPELPVMMSALPSPFRSARAIAVGPVPVGSGLPADRNPARLPRNTDTSLLAMLATAMSPMPSPSTSPIATAVGERPTLAVDTGCELDVLEPEQIMSTSRQREASEA